MSARPNERPPAAHPPFAAPQGSAALVMARLGAGTGATRAEIVRDLMPLVAHKFSPAEWRARAAEDAAALVAAGLAAETRGRLAPTSAGEQALRALCGQKGTLPSTWADMRDQRLVARALGLEQEGPQRLKALATPEGLRALVLQKSFGLPLKGNQTANRLRVELAVVALERAFGNKIKGGLGGSGGFSAKAGRLLAAQLSARPRDFGSDGRLIAELAAEQCGSPQADADALRLALLRRLATSLLGATVPVPLPAATGAAGVRPAVRESPAAAPTPANDAEPAALSAPVSSRPGIEDFAREVKAAAERSAEGWPGNRKAFISRVWQAIRASWTEWHLSEIEFKCMLAEAHRAGQIVLANADLKDKRSIADIEASAISYKNTVWHYIRVEE